MITTWLNAFTDGVIAKSLRFVAASPAPAISP